MRNREGLDVLDVLSVSIMLFNMILPFVIPASLNMWTNGLGWLAALICYCLWRLR